MERVSTYPPQNNFFQLILITRNQLRFNHFKSLKYLLYGEIRKNTLIRYYSASTMAKITGTAVGNFTSKLKQVVLSSSAGVNEWFSALNIFLSITAFLGNALILVALH